MGGDGSCVVEGSCVAGNHDGGDGTCVAENTCVAAYVLDESGNCSGCAAGYHDGGDGSCIVESLCLPGYRDGGDGTCVEEGSCAGGYHDGGDGSCVAEGNCASIAVLDENGDCIACPEDERNGGDNVCVFIEDCSEGYQNGGSLPEEVGTCVPEGECTPGFCVEDSCWVNTYTLSTCTDHLECIYDGSPDYFYAATCKQICTSNEDCSNGQECSLGFLGEGVGICAFLQGPGDSCTGGWTEGDTFCWDTQREEMTTAGFLCFEGACQYWCDYGGNEWGAYQCPSDSVCSEEMQYFETYGVDVALCVASDGNATDGGL